MLRKQASDLLDKYVGGTEKALAAAFAEARERRAVLLLDEADSLLQSRRTAQRPWEVSQVNELLVQMERFDGVLVCATNLIERLDEAVMRRFDRKIRFAPLSPEQAARLFAELLRSRGAKPGPTEDWTAALARLGGLTAGDFATVTRQTRLFDERPAPERLLALLEAELAVRDPQRGRTPIGFVS